MSALYFLKGFYPFGDRSILIMDAADQYVEFFSGLHYWGKTGNALFSWSKGFGQNNIGLFAYYLSSPFSAIVLLFPQNQVTLAMTLITLLKIACCGAAMTLFLHEWYQKWDWKYILFGTAYALMSYNMVYSMCLMWLDGVLLLPIVLIGVAQMARQTRPVVLLFSLAALFIANYYISYMVVLFAVLFFCYICLAEEQMHDGVPFARKLLICAGCVILAGGLGSWLLLPTLISLFQGKMGGLYGNPSAELLQFSLPDLLGKLLSEQYDSITYNGVPSIYCGSAAVVLSCAFFWTNRISPKARIAAGVLLVFLALSFWFSPLDLIWHVFQRPNWFPYRYAFIFSFFLLFLACRGCTALERLPKERKILTAVTGFAILLVCDFFAHDESVRPLVVALVLSALTVAAFCVQIKPAVLRVGLSALVSLVLCAELLLNGGAVIDGLHRQFGYKNQSDYNAFQTQLHELVQQAESDCDLPFFRIEKDYERSKNDAIGGGYNGITHYSSAYNQYVNAFTHELGMSQAYFWDSAYGSTPLTDTLFGVRYRMMKGDVCDWYTRIGESGNVTLWRNSDALGLAFAASGDVLHSARFSGTPTDNQTQLMRDVTGSAAEYWIPADLLKTETDGVSASLSGTYREYRKTGGAAYVRYRFRAAADGPIYAYFPTPGTESCTMRVNQKSMGVHFTSETNDIVYCGTFRSGDTVAVEFRLSGDTLTVGAPVCCTLDTDALRAAVQSRAEQQLNITSFSVTRISGTITAQQDGALFTSIPYDSGWTVRIDGKSVPTSAYQNTMLITELSAGTHEVELRYSPAGFHLGVLISACSAAMLILLFALRRMFRKSAD